MTDKTETTGTQEAFKSRLPHPRQQEGRASKPSHFAPPQGWGTPELPTSFAVTPDGHHVPRSSYRPGIDVLVGAPPLRRSSSWAGAADESGLGVLA